MRMSTDASMEQTAGGLEGMNNNNNQITEGLYENEKDIKILRELAKKVAELSQRPVEENKRKLWTRHNDLKQTRPLIFIDPENGWNELITQDNLKCEIPLLRVWEMSLRKEIYWAEELKDDRVIEPYFDIPYSYVESNYGLKEKK